MVHQGAMQLSWLIYFILNLSFSHLFPEKYRHAFSHLFHALDVWHKSVKLTKKLAYFIFCCERLLLHSVRKYHYCEFNFIIQAAKVKGCEQISEWSEPIRNHFWFICENCCCDEEKLKVFKFLKTHKNHHITSPPLYINTQVIQLIAYVR
jgi:capsule polysaccharide modification protein KpsS